MGYKCEMLQTGIDRALANTGVGIFSSLSRLLLLPMPTISDTNVTKSNNIF